MFCILAVVCTPVAEVNPSIFCDSDPVDTVGNPEDELLFGAATPGGGANGVGDVLLEIGG